MSDLTKLTALLVPRAVAALNDAADLSGDTRTDVLNRAVQVYAFILKEQAEGRRLALVDEDGTIGWVRLL